MAGRNTVNFFRTVTLPSGIDAEHAQASYHNGVLELHFPRTEQSKGRRIPVQGQQHQPEQMSQQAPTAAASGPAATEQQGTAAKK